MAAGSNAIEFRVVVMKTAAGELAGERWQVRTKDVNSSILGLIPLASSWSAWQEISVTVVEETV